MPETTTTILSVMDLDFCTNVTGPIDGVLSNDVSVHRELQKFGVAGAVQSITPDV